jgi:hypothetical protein
MGGDVDRRLTGSLGEFSSETTSRKSWSCAHAGPVAQRSGTSYLATGQEGRPLHITVDQGYSRSGLKRLDVASKLWPSADRCVATRSSRVKVSAGKLTVAAANVRDTQRPST